VKRISRTAVLLTTAVLLIAAGGATTASGRDLAAARDLAAVDFGSGTLGDYGPYSHCDTNCRGVDYATKRYVYSTSWDTADVGLMGDSIAGRGWGDLLVLLAGRNQDLAVNYWGNRPTAPTARRR
jgi:hypothetical protein